MWIIGSYSTSCFTNLNEGLQLDTSLIGQFKIKISDWQSQRIQINHSQLERSLTNHNRLFFSYSIVINQFLMIYASITEPNRSNGFYDLRLITI